MQPGKDLTFAPQWTSLTTGTLAPRHLQQPLPTGWLRQPFALFEFCVAAADAAGKRLRVETLSRARGKSTTLMYVARVTQPSDSHSFQGMHIAQGSYAHDAPACARHHHLAQPLRANSTACNPSGEVGLSALSFAVPSDAAKLADAATGQLCYRAYVMMHHRHRMLADLGLRVKWL